LCKSPTLSALTLKVEVIDFFFRGLPFPLVFPSWDRLEHDTTSTQTRSAQEMAKEIFFLFIPVRIELLINNFCKYKADNC